MLERICAPAILYLGFSLIYIVIDLFGKKYTEASIKFIIMFIMSIVLNILCDRGLKVIAYMVVFLPLMFMFYLSGLLVYIFGLPGQKITDSDLTSDSDEVKVTTSKTTSSSPGKIVGGNTGYVLGVPEFKCDPYCDPNTQCTEQCYEYGCYKEGDKPNTCWKKYESGYAGGTNGLNAADVPGAVTSGRCSKVINEYDCKTDAENNGMTYKGTIAGGSKYPSECFVKGGGKGFTEVWFNTGSGRTCNDIDTCLCTKAPLPSAAKKTDKCSVTNTISECKKIANRFSYKYEGTIGDSGDAYRDTATETKYPEGCFIMNGGSGGGSVYYNNAKGGNCSSMDPCLCA